MGQSELHNILFARGPGFKKDMKVETPSGNIDLTPTILELLGLPAGQAYGWAGPGGGPGWGDRILRKWSGLPTSTARRAPAGDRIYRQQIRLSRVGNSVYVDGGTSSLVDR